MPGEARVVTAGFGGFGRRRAGVVTEFLGLVGARPVRLLRCRAVLGEVADGLRTRAAGLDVAVAGYVARTERDHQADIGSLVGAVEALSEVVRDLGLWVGAVGEAFLDADEQAFHAADGWPASLHLVTLDGVHRSSPEVFADRFFEVASPVQPSVVATDEESGSNGGLFDALGLGEGVTALDAVLQVARGAGEAGRGAATMTAMLSSDRFGRIVTGAGRAAAGIGAVLSARSRWQADEDLGLPVGERVGRVAAQVGVETAGAALGAAGAAAVMAGIGAATGSAIGPIGTAAGTVAGAAVGAVLGAAGADEMLDRDPPRPEPDDVGDDIAVTDDDAIDDLIDEVHAVIDEGGAVPDWREAGRDAWTDPAGHANGFDEAALLDALAVSDTPWPGDPATPFGPKPDMARDIATGQPA